MSDTGKPAAGKRPAASDGNSAPKKRPNYYPGFNRYAKKPGEIPEKPFVFYLKSGSESLTQSVVGSNPFARIENDEVKTSCLPSGWKFYFPYDDLSKLEPEKTATKVKAFQDYLRVNGFQFDFDDIRITYKFDVFVDQLEMPLWPTFRSDLMKNPDHSLNCLGFSMHLHIIRMTEESGLKCKEKYLHKYTARIVNLDIPLTHLKAIDMDLVGNLIRIRGTLVRICDSDYLAWRMFECAVCSVVQGVYQRDGKTVPPQYCKSCHQRTDFDELPDSLYNCATLVQGLRLQESMKYEATDLNATQKYADIQLSQEMVNNYNPGDEVMIIGIVKYCVEVDKGTQYRLYVDAVNVFNNKESNYFSSLDFTELDRELVEKIRSEPCPFRLFVQSLCPKIIGQEMVKAGLLLGLFSGSPRGYKGMRRESHVLIVGDPGMGKSELLQACSVAAQKGVFVSSNNCTKSGLTVNLKQDSSNRYTLESGALVMADQGVCCFDEFDKVTANKEVLLEVMEEQVVNVTKAGVICTLSAKTSILAAANPIGGHYNKAKTITENIKIPLPILSRFDLIYIMIDKHEDALESAETSSFAGAQCLAARLKLRTGEQTDLLPLRLLQKYITFAIKNCLPVLSQEAKASLKEYYLKLRNQPFYSDIIPVTTRQLIALIRLTQARARIDLQAVASERHAQDVIKIVEYSIRDVKNITEEDLLIQSEYLDMGKRSEQTTIKQQLNKFTRFLQIKCKSKRLTTFSLDELKDIAADAGVRSFLKVIDLLNLNDVLLKKSSDTYQFVNY